MKIGVVLPIAEHPEKRQIFSFSQIRELARVAEDVGFDSAWLFDHLIFRFPDRPATGIWELWTMLAAVAAVTERVELGTLVICTAFRNPAVLAKMADTLEEISGGRLILGLGAGWHQPEFDAFGISFDHKVDRFEEALQIIAPLLREGRVDFHGRYESAPNCELLPRGSRPGGPPILVGAFKPRMLRLTARHADAWNTCWHGFANEKFATERAALEEACRAEGRDPASIKVTVGLGVQYTPGADDAERPARDKALSGSVDEVAEGFAEYARLGVDHLVCALDVNTAESFAWLAEAAARSRKV